jgi:hypothetical protein
MAAPVLALMLEALGVPAEGMRQQLGWELELDLLLPGPEAGRDESKVK